MSVGIGHHTRNDKAEFLIKLVWMVAQVSDLCQMLKDVGVKINPCKGCHIVLIISPNPNCQTPSFSDYIFKVTHKLPSNPTPLSVRFNDQWMDFPDVPIILTQPTNPAYNLAVMVNSYMAYPIFPKGFSHLLQSGCHVGPSLWRMCFETLNQQYRNLLDSPFIVGRERDDLYSKILHTAPYAYLIQVIDSPRTKKERSSH